MLKMKVRELREIVDSKVVECPYDDCIYYGEHSQCHSHLYVKCHNFEQWYESLAREEIENIYNTQTS